MRASGAWILAMVALASCRVKEPGPPAEAPLAQGGTAQGGTAQREPSAEPEPRGSGGGERTAASRGAAPEPTSPRPGLEAPEPAPPQSLVPIATSFSPTALPLAPLHDASPVVLFPDERAAVRRRAGEVLAAQRVELVPVPELERIEAAAAEGRLVLEGDQRCRAALTPDEVASRYFPGRPRLKVAAECFDDCRLRVTVDDPPKYEDMRAWESPKLTRVHDPKAWLAAAGRLRATDAMGIGGLGLFGTSHAPPVQFFAPVGIGPWPTGQPEDAPFSALEGTIASCAHPDPRVGFMWQVRASVDRRGSVTRCVAEADHSLAHVAGAGCLCAAVETLQFPAGAAGRRLRVEALDEGGGTGLSGRLELVQPGTEAWIARLREAPALARCVQANPLPDMLATRVILSLAPDGAIETVRVDGDITTPARMGLASCLVQELRTVPLPCRPPGIDALHVSLTVNGL